MDDLSYRLAKMILDWHNRFGAEAAFGRMEREHLMKYRRTLEDFSERWSTDRDVPSEIARCQLSGIFEYFYGEVVPAHMLSEAQLKGVFPPNIEVTLSELAKRILHPEPQRGSEETPWNEETIFVLGEDWIDHPHTLRPLCSRLPARGKDQRDVVMAQCDSAFHKLNHHGLGGQMLLASLHESAYRHRDHPETEDSDSVDVYSPGSFGLQLASGPGTAVSAIMGGHLRVANVLVGVQSDWAVAPTKESEDGHHHRH